MANRFYTDHSSDIFKRAKACAFLVSDDAQNMDILTLSSGGNHLIIDDVLELLKLKWSGELAYFEAIEHFAVTPIAQDPWFLTLAASRTEADFYLAGTAWRFTPAALDPNILRLKMKRRQVNRIAHQLAFRKDWRKCFLNCTSLTIEQKKQILLFSDDAGRAVAAEFIFEASIDDWWVNDIEILASAKSADGRVLAHLLIARSRQPEHFIKLMLKKLTYIHLGESQFEFNLRDIITKTAVELSDAAASTAEQLALLLVGLSQLYAFDRPGLDGSEIYFNTLNEKIAGLVISSPDIVDDALGLPNALHKNAHETVEKIQLVAKTAGNPHFDKLDDEESIFLY